MATLRCEAFPGLYFILSYVLLWSRSVDGQTCSVSGSNVGMTVTNRPDFEAPNDPYGDNTFIILDKGTISCHGVIKEWKMWRGGTRADVIHFQVYRETPTSDIPGGHPEFTLLAQNIFDLSDPFVTQGEGEITLYVGPNEQIPVFPGDIIAWRQENDNELMSYEENCGTCGQVLRMPCQFTATGQVCVPFFTAGTWETRDYSLQAVVYQALPPQLDNLAASVTISEGLPIGTQVYVVRSSVPYPLTQNPTDITHVNLTFSLDSQSQLYFQLNQTTISAINSAVNVTTAVVLDHSDKTDHTITVTVSSLQMSVSNTLTVNVFNRNDPHSITNLPATVNISAPTSSAGTQVYQVEVYDHDNPQPSDLRYFILSASQDLDIFPFTINQMTGGITCKEDMFVRHWPLEYNMTVQVTDMVHIVQETLTIMVYDVVTAPNLTNLPDNTTIRETIMHGTHIYQVTAYSSVPQNLRFVLQDIYPVDGTKHFDLDGTGMVSVKGNASLDYFVSPSYDISVVATDGVNASLADNLTVYLQMVNRQPQFQPNLYKFLLPEKTNDGTAFASVNAIDREYDNGHPGSTITCDILTGPDASYFDIELCTDVRVMQYINLDGVGDNVTLSITVKVEDEEFMSDTADIEVLVYDVNDNYPQFNQTHYIADVPENEKSGWYVTTVHATDLDAGVNAHITYALSHLYFDVHPSTGVVTTKQPIDYETVKKLQFTVTAIDGGGLSTDVWVSVDIVDRNDNRPEFNCSSKPDKHLYPTGEECFYNIQVRKNSDVGTKINLLTAEDVDDASLGQTYFLLKPEMSFLLNETSGQISLRQRLRARSYHLYCYANDNGVPNMLSGPSITRIDTFDPETCLVDITLGMTETSFSHPSVQDDYIWRLRQMLHPWVVMLDRYHGVKGWSNRTKTAIYALKDNSSFSLNNLQKKKSFVGHYTLLSKLQRNIHGFPSPISENE